MLESLSQFDSRLVSQLVRTKLEDVGPNEKVVESLIPMWQEEKLRCSGHLPEGPPSPPRTPEPLCKTVEDLRAQYHVRTSSVRIAMSLYISGRHLREIVICRSLIL